MYVQRCGTVLTPPLWGAQKSTQTSTAVVWESWFSVMLVTSLVGREKHHLWQEWNRALEWLGKFSRVPRHAGGETLSPEPSQLLHLLDHIPMLSNNSLLLMATILSTVQIHRHALDRSLQRKSSLQSVNWGNIWAAEVWSWFTCKPTRTKD